MAAPRKRAVMDDDHSDDEEVAVTGASRNNADDKLARAQREGRVIELDEDDGPSSPKRTRGAASSSGAPAAKQTEKIFPGINLDELADDPVFPLEMRRIQVGTFDCGACTLVFEPGKCMFHVEEGRVLPNGGSVAVPITLPITNMSRMEVSKKRAVMCITGFFGLDQFGDHYEEYSNLGHPKNRILCEFAGDADAWQAKVGGYPDIMRNFKDVRTKTHFETQNHDWVADLMKFKRYELSLKQGDPSGSGSRGAQLVEAATGTGMARTAHAHAPASGATPQQIVSLDMRRVQVGTFDCGYCTLVFEPGKCSFFVEANKQQLPNGESVAVPIRLSITNMSRLDISKKRAVMCITGFFGLEQFGEHYEEYLPLGHPKTRILCEFAGDNAAWQAPAGGFKEIMNKFKDVKAKSHFDMQDKDWVDDLIQFKRFAIAVAGATATTAAAAAAAMQQAAQGTGMMRKTGGIPGIMRSGRAGSSSGAGPSSSSSAAQRLEAAAAQGAPARAADRAAARAAERLESEAAARSAARAVRGKPRKDVRGSRVVVTYKAEEDGAYGTYRGVVRDFIAKEIASVERRRDGEHGLYVHFDGLGTDEDAWVHEGGDDEWCWEEEYGEAPAAHAEQRLKQLCQPATLEQLCADLGLPSDATPKSIAARLCGGGVV